MKITPIILIIILAVFANETQACSMYKITVDGKTMVGCNEDAWRTTSKIWFENARTPHEYGAGFTGSRQVGSNRTAPQSGMNETGLTFSRLVAYHPIQSNPFPNRTKITDEVDYLTDIMHKCATVGEVKKYIEQYDHSLFYDHVFIYIDTTGQYLVVEPYQLIEGNDPNYVLSNFCPSITSNQEARQLRRFKNGEDFIKNNEVRCDLEYCRSLSDTMHVCRSRNGDGTLLTSIWDTKDKLVNLYFYHSYDTTVQFSLTEELAKGNHAIDVANLFPFNAEFERLGNYKTPSNTVGLRISLVVLAGLLALFSLVLGIVFISKNRSVLASLKSIIGIGVLNVLLMGYMFVLATNKNIFYFDAPYQDYSSSLVSVSSYMPFLLLLVIVPLTIYTVGRLRSTQMKAWLKGVLIANNIVYFILITGFTYWGLYNIW